MRPARTAPFQAALAAACVEGHVRTCHDMGQTALLNLAATGPIAVVAAAGHRSTTRFTPPPASSRGSAGSTLCATLNPSPAAADTSHMAGTMYVAAIEESDGVTYEYVLHAASISDAERKARLEAGRRDATLVEVTSALPRNGIVSRWRGERRRWTA